MSLLQRDGLPRRLAGPLRRRGGLLLAVLVCAVLVYAVLAAFGFNTEARRVPLVIGVPATLAAIALVVKELRSPTEPATDDPPVPPGTPGVPAATDLPATRGARDDTEEAPDTPPPATLPAPATPPANQISTAAACAWVLVLGAMFLFLGLLVTIPLFVVVFMRVYGRESWPTVLLTTAVSFVTIYLFFIRFLSIQTFEGWVRIWLGW
jgi:hypothetical protein